jgi:hypothetical protein
MKLQLRRRFRHNKLTLSKRGTPMKTLNTMMIASGVLALVSLAFGQTTTPTPSAGAAEPQQLTRLVSDARCKGQHFRKALTPLTCTLKCVGEGADYVLVVGDTVYTLEGHAGDLDRFAGGRATVTGQVDGNKIAVD